MTGGRLFDAGVKIFNIESNGGIFDVSPRKRWCVTQCENPIEDPRASGGGYVEF